MRFRKRPQPFQAVGERFRAETAELDNQKIVLEDELDRKAHEVDAMRDEAETRLAKYNMLNDKAEEAKAVCRLVLTRLR